MSSGFDKPELPAIGFVADMDEDERRLLSSYGEFIPAHEGSVVIQQGKGQNSLFLVISGLLHVQVELDGRNTLLGRLRTGDMIGEINIFDPAAASATVSAVEFTQLWRIDKEMLEVFLRKSPATAANLLMEICTQLAKRVRATNEKVTLAQEAISQSMLWK